MIELVPVVAPVAAGMLLQIRVVRTALLRLFPGVFWVCQLLPWMCR